MSAENFLQILDDIPPVITIFGSFVISLVLAPYSLGFIFFLLFLIIYEFFWGYFTRMQHPRYNPIVRAMVVIASILGFSIGRLIIKDMYLFEAI